MAEFISHSVSETEGLGETWGRSAARGLVIGLSGDLGAGKTQLVKGIARGLGIPGRVHSPTFNLVNVYRGGRLTLFHLDLYRLPADAAREQILAAGLYEYLSPDGVTVIEWAEKWFGDVPGVPERISTVRAQAPGNPELYRRVSIETLNTNQRRIVYEDFGA